MERMTRSTFTHTNKYFLVLWLLVLFTFGCEYICCEGVAEELINDGASNNNNDNNNNNDSSINDISEKLDTNLQQRMSAVRLSVVSKDVSYSEEGSISARSYFDIPLHIHGFGLTNETQLRLTTAEGRLGSPCRSDGLIVQSPSFPLTHVSEDRTHGKLVISGGLAANEHPFYFCLRDNLSGMFVHQGVENSLTVEIYDLILPVWIMGIFIVVLLSLSGLFSGLNLGLMALDPTELKIVQNTGGSQEKRYANMIAPIRAQGNFLLCSLLLGNVLVNNSLTIMLDTLTSGLVAIIGATLGIVVFGEIIPQAICSRHGLAVGAYTLWLTKFFMILTFPLSFPISKLLDKLLGAEIGTVYDKKKLIELIRVTQTSHDLGKEEVDIVTGALIYKEKTAKHVMTKIEDVYMLPINSVLDFETLSEIQNEGYSRIPVFDGDRTNIIHILFAKDLLFVDVDDKMPLSVVCEFYRKEVNFVFEDTSLDVLFGEFKTGMKGHMAFVQNINNSGDGDPFYQTIGLITLEDIIEEIIQQEIVDETDVYTDNRTKKRLKRKKQHAAVGHGSNPFLYTAEDDPNKKDIIISPQLSLAILQFLVTSIEPFKPPHMVEMVLRRLLNFNIFHEVRMKKKYNSGAAGNQQSSGSAEKSASSSSSCDDNLIIIENGKPIDFFVLIIEGRAEVIVGPDELVFEAGPFSHFGLFNLKQVLKFEKEGKLPNSPLTAMGTSSNPHTGLDNKRMSTSVISNALHDNTLKSAANRRTSLMIQPGGGGVVVGPSSHPTARPPIASDSTPPTPPVAPGPPSRFAGGSTHSRNSSYPNVNQCLQQQDQSKGGGSPGIGNGGTPPPLATTTNNAQNTPKSGKVKRNHSIVSTSGIPTHNTTINKTSNNQPIPPCLSQQSSQASASNTSGGPPVGAPVGTLSSDEKALPTKFVPDYTVKVASPHLLYLLIKRTTYLTAMRASQMAQREESFSGRVSTIDEEALSKAVAEGLETVDEDAILTTSVTDIRSLAASIEDGDDEREGAKLEKGSILEQTTSSSQDHPKKKEVLQKDHHPHSLNIPSKTHDVEGGQLNREQRDQELNPVAHHHHHPNDIALDNLIKDELVGYMRENGRGGPS